MKETPIEEYNRISKKLTDLQSALERCKGQKELTEKQLMALLKIGSMTEVEGAMSKLKKAADKAKGVLSEIETRLTQARKELEA